MMDRRVMTGVMLIFIILLFVFGVVVADTVIEGKRVTVHGTVSYNMATGWDITTSSYNVVDDSLFNIAFFYMPWETKDVLVEIILINNQDGTQYTGHRWIGRSNVIYSNKPYEVMVNFVPVGSYSATIVLYEVDKGFWGVFEQSRVEQGRTTMEIIV